MNGLEKHRSVLFIGGPHSGRVEMIPRHCKKATIPARPKERNELVRYSIGEKSTYENHDYTIEELDGTRAIAWHDKTPRAELLLMMAKDFEGAQAKRDEFLNRDNITKAHEACDVLYLEYQRWSGNKFVDRETFGAAFKFGFNFAKRGFVDTARNVAGFLFFQKDWFES